MPRKNVFKRNEAKAAGGGQPGGPEGNGAAAPVNARHAADQGLAPLPLFYKEPGPLQVAPHGGKAHAVVPHSREFRLAAASYPIIFRDAAPAMPSSSGGIREGFPSCIGIGPRWTTSRDCWPAAAHAAGWR